MLFGLSNKTGSKLYIYTAFKPAMLRKSTAQSQALAKIWRWRQIPLGCAQPANTDVPILKSAEKFALIV